MKEQAQALAEARTNYEELAAIYASQKREWEESVAELAGYVADAKDKMQALEFVTVEEVPTITIPIDTNKLSGD